MIHYLDYAATSAIRPPEVARAMADYLGGCGATPGRGGHRWALDAGRMALRVRRALTRILGLPGGAERFVFTPNATVALNTALKGVLGPGDALVVTAFDHNAVLRPAHALARDRGVEVRLVRGFADGRLDEEAFTRALEGARLVSLNAVSNVLGTRLPLRRLAGLARDAGALVLVDAAQSAGCIPQPLDFADLVAVTGHKGLLGPQGTGGLWIREGLDLDPLVEGGTGGDSSSREMPSSLPDRFEAGSLNAPGLAGLEAGLVRVELEGIRAIHDRTMKLKARLREGLSQLPGVRLLSPPAPDGGPIVTLRCEAMDPASLAHRLDRDHGVLARAGLHCAPEVHSLLGTGRTGALRLSLGWASSQADVDAAVEGVAASVPAPPVIPVA